MSSRRPHRVTVLALDGVYPFDLGIPARILGAADGRYEIVVCSADGLPVETNAGFSVSPRHGPDALATADMIRTDHGTHLANHAARRCVVPPFRDGGQAQYIEHPAQYIEHPVPEDAASTSATRQWALQHLGEPLTLPQMAQHAHMSVRTFARRFRDETGLPPRQWLIRQRLDRARHLLESSRMTVDQIAGEVGFATATSLRQHLNAELGVSPLAYRRTFQGADPA